VPDQVGLPLERTSPFIYRQARALWWERKRNTPRVVSLLPIASLNRRAAAGLASAGLRTLGVAEDEAEKVGERKFGAVEDATPLRRAKRRRDLPAWYRD
jgi:hypothetical protein